MIGEEEAEEDFSTSEESLISFRLSGPNEEADDELASSEDSVVHSPHKKC
mgnify:CR=1 FL=1